MGELRPSEDLNAGAVRFLAQFFIRRRFFSPPPARPACRGRPETPGFPPFFEKIQQAQKNLRQGLPGRRV